MRIVATNFGHGFFQQDRPCCPIRAEVRSPEPVSNMRDLIIDRNSDRHTQAPEVEAVNTLRVYVTVDNDRLHAIRMECDSLEGCKWPAIAKASLIDIHMRDTVWANNRSPVRTRVRSDTLPSHFGQSFCVWDHFNISSVLYWGEVRWELRVSPFTTSSGGGRSSRISI